MNDETKTAIETIVKMFARANLHLQIAMEEIRNGKDGNLVVVAYEVGVVRGMLMQSQGWSDEVGA